MDDLRTRLARGDTLVGTFLTYADPALAELVAAPWDVVVIDVEHSALDRCAVQLLLIAARAAGTPALVRVVSSNPPDIKWVVDAGAAGILVPLIEDRAQASVATGALRYPPEGTRGIGQRRLLTVAPSFGGLPCRPLCLVQIETPLGVANANEICATSGLDGVVLGSNDYISSLDASTEVAADELSKAAAVISAAAEKHGIVFGIAGGPNPQ